MAHHIENVKKPVALLISFFIMLTSFAYVAIPAGKVYAADETQFRLSYSPELNTFTLKTSPESTGDVALSYQNSKKNVKAVFGSINTPLPAKTCSTEECVNDVVTYGVIKSYIPEKGYIYTLRFKMNANSVVTIEESGVENVRTTTTVDAKDNPFLALNATEKDWIQSSGKTSESPTVTATPSPTLTTIPTSSPTATAAPTVTGIPTSGPAPTTCKEGLAWASGTYSVNQGRKLSNLPVDSARSRVANMYGAPDGKFFSAGMGGEITISFENSIKDVPGGDISVYEISYDRIYSIEEFARVEVSADGSNWYILSTMVRSKVNPVGVTFIDFNESGLNEVRYVRFVDVINPYERWSGADGIDIDAVQATKLICPPVVPVTPTPTIIRPTNAPSPTPTNTPTPTPAFNQKITKVEVITKSCYLLSLVCNPIISIKGENLEQVSDVKASLLGFEKPGIFFTDGTGTDITVGFPELLLGRLYTLTVSFSNGNSITIPRCRLQETAS